MGRGIELTEAQWDELDRVRLTTDSADVFRNCLIILMSDSRDTIAAIAKRLGCGTDTVVRIRRLYRRGGRQSVASPPLARSPQSGYTGVPRSDETSSANQSPDAGLWLLDVVGRTLGGPLGQDHRDSIQRRSTGPPPARAWVFHPSSQAYPQRQAGRRPIRQGQKATGRAQKKKR